MNPQVEADLAMVRRLLPEGWVAEEWGRTGWIVVERHPEGGLLTLDFKARAWTTGMSRPRPHVFAERDRQGRGWKAIMTKDAIDHLKGCP